MFNPKRNISKGLLKPTHKEIPKTIQDEFLQTKPSRVRNDAWKRWNSDDIAHSRLFASKLQIDASQPPGKRKPRNFKQ